MTVGNPLPASKRALRAQVLNERARLDPASQARAAQAFADHMMALADLCGAHRVAAYVSVDGEPGTGPTIERLHAAGIPVILPKLREDFDLDWAGYVPGAWRPGRFGLLEPTAPPLGLHALQEVSLIICPGVAGTRDGHRLGRGGGSYDRALARALPMSLRCLLLYDDEVLDAIPTEPHDQRVDLIATPSELIRISPARF